MTVKQNFWYTLGFRFFSTMLLPEHFHQNCQAAFSCYGQAYTPLCCWWLILPMQMQKAEKLLKPWLMGSHLRLLSESYQMNTNMTGFRCFFLKYVCPCALNDSSLSIRWVNRSTQSFPGLVESDLIPRQDLLLVL